MNDQVTYCGFYCGRCPQFGTACVGCRQGGADPDCPARQCAQKRKVDMCALCGDFPCDKMKDHITRFPFLKDEAGLIKEKGVDLWVTEQEKQKDKKYY